MPVVLKLIDASGNPIKGESKVPGHEDEIDIAAWSWGVTAPAGAALNILDISIKKSIDLASPVLLRATTRREMLAEGVLTVIDQQGATPDFLVLTLMHVTVASMSVAEEQFPPLEQIVLHFDEMEFNYKGEHTIVSRLP
jgi:type VI secretion system secreted protein Hcp